ncbi:MAG: ComEA family DNA-binding protein [Candidatus Nanopelagicales bacterium]
MPSATAPRPSSHLIWALSPAYCCGMVPFIPALHAAIKLQTRSLWYWAAGLVLGSVAAWVMVLSGPARTADDPTTSATLLQTIGTVLTLVLGTVGTIHAFRVRDAVFGPQVPRIPTPEPMIHPAIRDSLAARKLRAESTALCNRDPGLARDLLIGRPDRVRQYDDGGLVDINHVPAEILVSHLGLTPEQAKRVVEAREYIDGFSIPEDIRELAGIPPKLFDEIRDRIVAL